MMKITESKKTVIEVCHGPVCRDSGGPALAREFAKKGINIVAGNCRGLCPNAPLVHLDNSTIFDATSEKIQTRIEEVRAKDLCSHQSSALLTTIDSGTN